MQTEFLKKKTIFTDKTRNNNGEQFCAFGQKYFASPVKIKKNIQKHCDGKFAALPYETRSVHKTLISMELADPNNSVIRMVHKYHKWQ